MICCICPGVLTFGLYDVEGEGLDIKGGGVRYTCKSGQEGLHCRYKSGQEGLDMLYM